ncbi:MAG: hypothetical protein N5P05_004130 (plasmid) [Chroococcopsis gigantea SAG 12.99]|jgi:hypothetical protein|nr:hypothetical protein [Chroococcopsis gigantea SAG 12.99]
MKFGKYLINRTLILLFMVSGIQLPSQAQQIRTVKVNLPETTGIGCQATINNIKEELKRKGFFVPLRIKVDKKFQIIEPYLKINNQSILEYYLGYPESRTESVVFGLGETDSLYSSPVYMTSLAAQIFAECPTVGLVDFNWVYEGGVSIGYFPDNTARQFINLSQAPELDMNKYTRTINTSKGQVLQFKWGYYLSP